LIPKDLADSNPLNCESWAKAGLRAVEQGTSDRAPHSARAGSHDFHRGRNVKGLRGIEPPRFRLRVGDYRVRFRDIDNTVEIISVKHSRDPIAEIKKAPLT